MSIVKSTFIIIAIVVGLVMVTVVLFGGRHNGLMGRGGFGYGLSASQNESAGRVPVNRIPSDQEIMETIRKRNAGLERVRKLAEEHRNAANLRARKAAEEEKNASVISAPESAEDAEKNAGEASAAPVDAASSAEEPEEAQ